MDPEVRVSPDGNMVAIRSDTPADAHNAWMVAHRSYGGHWATTSDVADWTPMARQNSPE